jgi:predicted chitinase
MHDFHVMLDSGANCGIFRNAQLLTNLRETDCSATISGIGGKLTTNTVGVFNGTSEVFFHPEAIANKTYGGRMGNGHEETGEGFAYRGRGLLQLTGKDNYRACSHDLFQDATLLEDPDLLTDPYYALNSACWFWNKNKLNQYADSGDFTTMTKRINGGTIGLEDRIHHYNNAVAILSS